MHQTVMDKGFYKVSPIKANYKRAVIETEHLSPEYVQFMTYYMNIELNFVENANMRLGRYGKALEAFENVIRVKSDHAIAHYFASKALDKMHQHAEAIYHFSFAETIVEKSCFWVSFIKDFDLKLSIPLAKIS